MTTPGTAPTEVHQQSAKSWIPLAVIAGLFILVAGGAFVAARVVEGQGSGSAPPTLDILIDVRANDGEPDPKQFPIGPRSEIIEGTIDNIADSTSKFGTTEIVRWEQVGRPGAGERVRCLGFFGDDSGSASCGPADADQAPIDDPTPEFGEGGSGRGNGQLDQINLNVNAVPTDTAWVVVETDRRIRIGGRVVDGVSFLEWDADAGKIADIYLLDDRFRTLWTADRVHALGGP